MRGPGAKGPEGGVIKGLPTSRRLNTPSSLANLAHGGWLSSRSRLNLEYGPLRQLSAHACRKPGHRGQVIMDRRQGHRR